MEEMSWIIITVIGISVMGLFGVWTILNDLDPRFIDGDSDKCSNNSCDSTDRTPKCTALVKRALFVGFMCGESLFLIILCIVASIIC